MKKYTEVTYRHDHKNNRIRFYEKHENNGWSGGGNLCDVVEIDNHFVVIVNMATVIGVANTWIELLRRLEKQTGCKPSLEK